MTAPRPLNKAGILASIPKSVTISPTTYAAHVEYADRGKTVNEILKTSPIAVTLRYYADRRDNEATPGNRQYGREVVPTGTDGVSDLRYTYGQKRQVTLSINVHVKDAATPPAGEIIDAYCELLKTWVLRDLPAVNEVVDDTGISDLSYLENEIERRQMDVLIRYDNTYQKTVWTIDTVEDPTFTTS